MSLITKSFRQRVLPAAFALFGLMAHGQTIAPAPAGPFLRVAAVQMRSTADIHANVALIRKYLVECAARGVEIAAFPECAVSSYEAKVINSLSAADLVAAEKEIAAACREQHIAAVVGLPARVDGRMLNRALIINAQGEIVARYDKAYLVEQDRDWHCVPGAGLPPVFKVGPALASVNICHDSRFPELCRLPVLAGARVIFYISSEAGLFKEVKMGPYRAQVQARAVENNVYIVHANPPANDLRTGSHGQSRIVTPEGVVLQEASQLQEEVLVADLDLSKATAGNALEALHGPLAAWWRAEVKQVPLVQ